MSEKGDVFLWIEVLSAADTPRLKDFNTRVADAWLAITLKVLVLFYDAFFLLFEGRLTHRSECSCTRAVGDGSNDNKDAFILVIRHEMSRGGGRAPRRTN